MAGQATKSRLSPTIDADLAEQPRCMPARLMFHGRINLQNSLQRKAFFVISGMVLTVLLAGCMRIRSGFVREPAGGVGWGLQRDGEGVNFCFSKSQNGLGWDRNRTETLLYLPSFPRLTCQPEKRFLIA